MITLNAKVNAGKTEEKDDVSTMVGGPAIVCLMEVQQLAFKLGSITGAITSSIVGQLPGDAKDKLLDKNFSKMLKTFFRDGFETGLGQDAAVAISSEEYEERKDECGPEFGEFIKKYGPQAKKEDEE